MEVDKNYMSNKSHDKNIHCPFSHPAVYGTLSDDNYLPFLSIKDTTHSDLLYEY